MALLYVIFLISLLFSFNHGSGLPNSKDLKCAVCRSLVGELHHEMKKVDPRKKVDIGSYRLQSDGDQKTARKPYAGSEMHMVEVMEEVCASFDDYAQARLKTTGVLEVIQIVGKDGSMNPRFGDYDILQDPDLNKGLKNHCLSIVEDFEDEIVLHFSTSEDTQVEKKSDFCTKTTSICSGRRTEL